MFQIYNKNFMINCLPTYIYSRLYKNIKKYIFNFNMKID